MKASDNISTYFISGHLDLTKKEFDEHYKEPIDAAIFNDCSFVVGDARGTDLLAQNYLMYKTKKVTVYHMFDGPRNNSFGYETCGGFTSDKERDSNMTKDSDADIAWVRPGREKSGTAKNIKRRK